MRALPAELGMPAATSTDRTTSARRGEPSGSPDGAEAQKIARLAGEFEGMLLLQMLREMRKSGSWKDESEDKDGFGAETLFDTLDQEMAAFIVKAQGFGLEKSLVNQVTGAVAGVSAIVPTQLPPLELPTTDDAGSRRSSDRPQDPLEDRVETSPFGWRHDPFSGAAKYHRGVDLRAAYGEAIGAAQGGTVVFAGEQGGYGQTVVVEHAGGVRTRYAHLSSLMTEAGAQVKAGEAVGRAGRSGRATGTHLHFEVTQDGRPVDPHRFMAGGLKVEGVTADWGSGNGPTLPGVASDQRVFALEQNLRLRLADDSVSLPRSAGRGSGAD